MLPDNSIRWLYGIIAGAAADMRAVSDRIMGPEVVIHNAEDD